MQEWRKQFPGHQSPIYHEKNTTRIHRAARALSFHIETSKLYIALSALNRQVNRLEGHNKLIEYGVISNATIGDD